MRLSKQRLRRWSSSSAAAAPVEPLEARIVLSGSVATLGGLIGVGSANPVVYGPGQPAGPVSAGIAGWTLVNADTGEALGSFSSGAVINLRELPTRHLDVRAQTVGDSISEVIFGLDGQRAISAENRAPYSVFGGSSWTPTVGRHTISATPIMTDATIGRSTAVTFSFIDADVGRPPDAEISTNPLSFGEIAVGSGSSKELTITNTGSVGPLVISAMRFEGADSDLFSSDFPGSMSIAPGESQTVHVSFLPVRDGVAGATLTIISNSANSPQEVALAGTGAFHVEPGDAYTVPVSPRDVISLDPNWKFKKGGISNAQRDSFDDSSWGAVNLPHTWNAQDGQDGGDNYYRGASWYRKRIDVPESFAGKEVFIRFGGAFLVTDLYVNGTKVGSHDGGFAAFAFDVTPYLKPGQSNLIAVQVDNSADSDVAPLTGNDVILGGADFTMFGGLYRDVDLIATPSRHVMVTDLASPGLFLTQKKVTNASAAVDAVVELRNDGDKTSIVTVRTDIVDRDGKLVQRLTGTQSVSAHKTTKFTQSFTVDNPHLWNGVADPYMYQAYVTVMDSGGTTVDVVNQPLGLRYYKVDAKNGFFLNGNYVDLHGVNYHQDRINEGWAVSQADRVEDVSLMTEMGVNFVRMSHYQQGEGAYDLFDESGIAVWSEIPYIYDSTDSSAFKNNIKQQLQEMIRQNYNHPSILFWGLFNGLELDNVNRTLVPQLNDLAHKEDPSRLTTGNTVTRAGEDSAINFYTDLIGYNDYFGWYRGSIDDLGDYTDTFHKDHPGTPLAIGEFGAGGSISQHMENPGHITATDGQFHPEDFQSLFHEGQWAQMKTRKYLWAKGAFSMFDFAVDGRDEGDTPGRNDKGMVTYDRKTKKDVFYFYKSNWTNTPTVYITDRRFTNRPDKSADIKIYSNLDTVELIVNGVSLGTKSGSDIKVFQWNATKLQSGTNTIQAIGTRDGQQYVDTVTWNA